MTKQNILITVALLIIIAVLGYFGYREYQYAAIDVREYESFDAFLEAGHTSDREIEIYTEKLKEAYEQDTYGSTTPEGTFDMFITALEEDDLELASKYFAPQSQKSALEGIKESKSNGVLPVIIENADNREVSVGETGASVRVYEEDGDIPYLFSLEQNQFNDLWKIESF